MNLFSNLLNVFKKEKTSSVPANQFQIDLTPLGVEINKTTYTLPLSLDVLVSLFGTPRKTDKFNMVYSWDNLGLYCYSKDKETAHTFGILMKRKKETPKLSPKHPFSGSLTICQSDWKTKIELGEDMEVLRQLALGDYMVIAEYLSFETCSDYESVEFTSNEHTENFINELALENEN